MSTLENPGILEQLRVGRRAAGGEACCLGERTLRPSAPPDPSAAPTQACYGRSTPKRRNQGCGPDAASGLRAVKQAKRKVAAVKSAALRSRRWRRKPPAEVRPNDVAVDHRHLAVTKSGRAHRWLAGL